MIEATRNSLDRMVGGGLNELMKLEVRNDRVDVKPFDFYMPTKYT